MADFGHRRRILCDLTIEYDRSLYVGAEEPNELSLLGRLLAPGDVFIDGGANIGLFTVFAGDVVGRQGHVVAIEPVPSTFARLRRSVELSGMAERAQLHNNALAAESGNPVTLDGTVHNVMHLAGAGGNGSVTAVTVTLDQVSEELPPVTGMKIDVEGSELAALQGGKRLFGRSSPWLFIEFNARHAETRELGNWEPHRFLSERGYQALLPHLLLRGDVTPLQDSWLNVGPFANLLYWHGDIADLATRLVHSPSVTKRRRSSP